MRDNNMYALMSIDEHARLNQAVSWVCACSGEILSAWKILSPLTVTSCWTSKLLSHLLPKVIGIAGKIPQVLNQVCRHSGGCV